MPLTGIWQTQTSKRLSYSPRHNARPTWKHGSRLHTIRLWLHLKHTQPNADPLDGQSDGVMQSYRNYTESTTHSPAGPGGTSRHNQRPEEPTTLTFMQSPLPNRSAGQLSSRTPL